MRQRKDRWHCTKSHECRLTSRSCSGEGRGKEAGIAGSRDSRGTLPPTCRKGLDLNICPHLSHLSHLHALSDPQEIMTAAADDNGEWYLPLTAEQVAALRAALDRNADRLDEALLSNAFAWIR